MSVTLEQRAAIGRKDIFSMARKMNKRTYGSGSIIELKGGLAIRWRVPVIQADGATRYDRGYENLGPVTRTEATQRITEHLLRIAKRGGPSREIAIPTFAEHALRYQKDILHMLETDDSKNEPSGVMAKPEIYKYSTRYGRQSILNKHLIPRFGPMPVSRITTAEIQEFITELGDRGYIQSGALHHYSAHTLHDIREVMRAVMNSSIAWYRQPVDLLTGLPVNPVIGVKLPKKLKPKTPKWALSVQECEALYACLKGKAQVMFALAIFCGMRRGELLAFRLRQLSVREIEGRRLGKISVTEASYHGHIDTPKTEKGVRDIELPDQVLRLIESWTQRSKKRNPGDLVFGTRMNRIENSNNILRRHFYPACDALGLPHVDWLTCRRTFQTLAHNEGVPARTIADIMGHEEVETQFIYSVPVETMKRVAADRLGTRLAKIGQDLKSEHTVVH